MRTLRASRRPDLSAIAQVSLRLLEQPDEVVTFRRSALLPLLAVVLSGCAGSSAGVVPSGPSPMPGTAGVPSAIQRSEGGGVTVEATWGGVASGATFDLKLDTHSVDLAALDLRDAILRNDRGETLRADPWSAPKGGHHRSGALTFAGDAGTFLRAARWIELVIRDVGGVPERVLHWDIAT